MNKFLSFLVPLLMVSCSFGTELSGVTVSRVIDHPGTFNEMVVKGGVNVTLDPTATAITVTGDSILVAAVNVSLDDKTLTIDASSKLFKRKGIKFVNIKEATVGNVSDKLDITVPTPGLLEEITLAGAVNFRAIDPIVGEKLEIESAGANRVVFTCNLKELKVDAAGADNYWVDGNVLSLEVELAGACNFGTRDRYITANKAKIDLAGACDAVICNVGSIKGELAGACSLDLTGPGETNVRSKGASSITRF